MGRIIRGNKKTIFWDDDIKMKLEISKAKEVLGKAITNIVTDKRLGKTTIYFK